jgi:hypothetical protein
MTKGRRIAFVTQGMKIISISGSLLVSSCSLSWYISGSSSDYNDTVETATNNVMVTNILRGRDSAPLSFSDLSQIRGSVTTSASTQFSWPFGPFGRDVNRTDTAQLGPLSISNAPTFDIAPLNTKIFAEGINEPVSIGLMWYYLQRFDASVVLPLFISRVEKVELAEKNDGTKYVNSITRLTPAEKETAMSIWIIGNQNTYPAKVNVVSEISGVGPSLSPNILTRRGIIADLAAASAAGLQLKGGPDGLLHLTKKNVHGVLCVASEPKNQPVHYQALAIARASVVTNASAIDWPNSDADCETVERPAQWSGEKRSTNSVRPQILVHLRSVESMGLLNDLLNLHRDATEIPTTKAVQTVP